MISLNCSTALALYNNRGTGEYFAEILIGDLNNAVSGDHTAIKAAANLIDAVMPIVEKQLQADVATMKANISAAYNNMVASLNSMNKGLE